MSYSEMRKPVKEVSGTITKAIHENKPISVKTYYLSDASEDSLRKIISSILEKYERKDLMEICYNSVKAMVVHATFANLKRALFMEMGLDIFNQTDYEKGLDFLEKLDGSNNFEKYRETFKKHNLSVKTTFDFSPELLSVFVKNNFILLPEEEYRLREKLQSAKSLPNLTQSILEPGTASNEVAESLPDNVVSLNEYRIGKQIFSLISDRENNETVIRLEIPLNDRKKFSNELFQVQMDNLFQEYKAQFEKEFRTRLESVDAKTSNLLSEFEEKTELSRQETRDILNKIQKLGNNLYEEQEALIASYGESVYKDVQDKLLRIKLDTDKAIHRIKEAGETLFEENKKQIDEFNDKLDEKISEQTSAFLDKHKKKIDEFNTALDRRIANQSSILQGQTNLYLDQMKKSNMDFIEASRKEFSKSKTEFHKIKEGIEDELKRALVMKQNLFNEMHMEKDSLKNSMYALAEKVRKMEKFHANMDKVEEMVRRSESSYLNISSKLEKLKIREEDVNSYLRNADLVLAAKKNSEMELKMIDAQKAKILGLQNELEKTNQACHIVNRKAEKLNEKMAFIDIIDKKFGEIEKFQDTLNQKLNDISEMGKKVSFMANNLNIQGKRTMELNARLNNISRDFDLLDRKGDDINQALSLLDTKLAEINAKSVDMKMMESKFNKIELMINDLSIRHKQIATMEKRLEDMKEGMQDLMNEADDKYTKFSSMMEEVDFLTSSHNKSRKKRKTGSNQKYNNVMSEFKDKVMYLYTRDNLDPEEISKKLGVELEIVHTILMKNI
ncbi:MAG: hypothetical protein H7A25_11040 [Leptospiraceae bacterium]|nr:hypothetical protein [Leptospiraceae bacterium]MCP5500431.1 hypothetical protein [Leptospiraceae bacterium]